MKTKIINLLEDKIAAAKPGDDKLICKFVLVICGDKLYLIFGLISEYPYHANLVDYFCNRFDIPSAWDRKPDMIKILDEDCNLSGGGWIEIDTVKAKMKFFGRSTAFGRFCQSDLDRVLADQRFFSDYRVVVSR